MDGNTKAIWSIQKLAHLSFRPTGEIFYPVRRFLANARNDNNELNERTKAYMKEYNFYVYILTNWNNEVMYIGMTNDLERRLAEHKSDLMEGFTKKYHVNKLVYYEHGTDVHAAIAREKEIKKWRREKKNSLVITINPGWKDLSLEWQEQQA